MDYNFFVKRIATMPEGLAEAGVVLFETNTTAASSPNFRQRPGFETLHSGNASEEVNAYVKQCAAVVSDIFPLAALREFEFNSLAAGASIPEHTDMMGVRNTGWRVPRAHKLHFVLKAEAGASKSGHRRSKELELREYVYEQQGIYVYNNYVFHNAWNSGTTARIHLVLIYRDIEWKLKKALYDKFDLSTKGY